MVRSVSAKAARRVYIQLRHGGVDAGVYTAYETVVARLGRVCARGQSPESDVRGCWFEVLLRTPPGSIADVRTLLVAGGLDAHAIHSVHLLTNPGDGGVFARQLDLFGSK